MLYMDMVLMDGVETPDAMTVSMGIRSVTTFLCHSSSRDGSSSSGGRSTVGPISNTYG